MWLSRATRGAGLALAVLATTTLSCDGDGSDGHDDEADQEVSGGEGSEPPAMDELFPDPGSVTVDGKTHEVERIHCRRMIRDHDLSVEMTGYIGETGQERLYRAQIDIGDHNGYSDIEFAFHDPNSDTNYKVTARERDHGWQPWDDDLDAFDLRVEDGFATGTLPMIEVAHSDPDFESEATLDAEVRIPVPEDHDLCAG